MENTQVYPSVSPRGGGGHKRTKQQLVANIRNKTKGEKYLYGKVKEKIDIACTSEYLRKLKQLFYEFVTRLWKTVKGYPYKFRFTSRNYSVSASQARDHLLSMTRGTEAPANCRQTWHRGHYMKLQHCCFFFFLWLEMEHCCRGFRMQAKAVLCILRLQGPAHCFCHWIEAHYSV